MELINDGVPEPKSEGVEVMLRVASGEETVVFQPRSSVTIIIQDNDRKALYIMHSPIHLNDWT